VTMVDSMDELKAGGRVEMKVDCWVVVLVVRMDC
jgi:hypothetical protein